jgi:hypothetical protein
VARGDGLLEQLPPDAAGRRHDGELHQVPPFPRARSAYPAGPLTNRTEAWRGT